MIVDPDTPQPKPLTGMPVPGIKTSDQIVSEIHGAMASLPPEHQAALDHGISVLKGPPSGASEAPPIPPGATPTATRGYYVENGVPYQSSPDSTAQHGASAALDEPVDSSIRFDGQPNFTPVAAPKDMDPGMSIDPKLSGGRLKDMDPGISIDPWKGTGINRTGGGVSESPISSPAQSAALPGIVNVTPNDIAANQPEIALPTKRSLSGRMSLLESPRMMSPSIGAYEPIPSHPSGAVTELKRLRDTGSGVSQIHNPFLKTLGTIADVVGSGFFPQLAQFVPGSSVHHQQLVGNKQAEVKQDEDLANNDEKRHLEHAQALNQESLPELAQQKVDSANYKTDSTRELGDAKNTIAQGELGRKADADKHKQALDLFKSGRKVDADGKVVNIPYEEMTPDQQVTHDLKLSQRELADSNADLADARAKNLPEQMKLAERRIANAQHNQQVALRRLDLSEKQFEMRAHGTQGGVALPGSLIADDGTPVGTAFQQNVRPTGQQRNKANLADSAAEQISDIKDIVKKRHDIFGPLNGRTTDFSVWLGSEDPDAKRFLTARTIAADHLAGVFGGRSEAALKALDQAIGQFKENPAAVEAGLDQVVKGNEVFQNAGKVKTTGSKAAESGKDSTPTVTTKAQYDALPKGATYMEDGKKYRKP